MTTTENNIKVDDHSGLQAKTANDFMVKKMPAFSSLSGENYHGEGGQSHATNMVMRDDSAKNHQKTGIIIISAGVVFIAVIFYLAYRFLISPALNDSPVDKLPLVDSQSVVTNVINEGTATEEEPIVPVPDDGDLIEGDLNGSVPGEEDLTANGNEKFNLVSLLTVIDSDNDGLSDAAEEYLGTDPLNPDTDGDGYSDREEILNGYNPKGEGALSDNLNLSLYRDSSAGYGLLYPTAWTPDLTNAGSVLFSAPAPDKEKIQVSYEDNEIVYNNIIEWYQAQFGEIGSLDKNNLVSSSYGPGIRSADGQFVYFLGDGGQRVFVISYIPAGSDMPYVDIFMMMTATFMRV